MLGKAFTNMEIKNPNHEHDYTFVVPCYNEVKNLPKLIDAITQYTKTMSDCKFILVENGSVDDSRIFLENLHASTHIEVIYLDQNQGYGGGIWAGVKNSQSVMTGWFHADLQIPFDDVIKMKEISKASDTSVKGRRTNRPLLDTFLTWGMSSFCSILFKTKLEDINGQPTIYESKMLRKYSSPALDFSFDLYFYIAAKKERIKLLRPKVTMVARGEGASSWNTGIKSRMRMITRTLQYASQLRLRNQND